MRRWWPECSTEVPAPPCCGPRSDRRTAGTSISSLCTPGNWTPPPPSTGSSFRGCRRTRRKNAKWPCCEWAAAEGVRRRHPLHLVGPMGVGVEGPPSDGDALAAGFREAGYRMQSLVVVHGTDYEFLERGHVDRLVAAAHVQNPTVDVRVHVQRGDAADLLVARSAQASLLVLGTRGRHEAAGTILGSTTQSVLRRAACPVMVARDGTLRPARAIPGFAGRTGARASGLSGRRSPGCDGP